MSQSGGGPAKRHTRLSLRNATEGYMVQFVGESWHTFEHMRGDGPHAAGTCGRGS